MSVASRRDGSDRGGRRRLGRFALVRAVTVIVAGAMSATVEAQASASPPQGATSVAPLPAPAAGALRPGPFGGAQPGVGGPRQQLEQRVRMRFEQIVRQRLQLTDAQVMRLRATNQQFAPERSALATRERQIRQSMRSELRPGVVPNEQRISVLTDSLFAVQRTRLDMLQSEQRQLATFLTPSQRVRYYALQEQLRRRVEAMRRRQQLGQLRGTPGGVLGAPDSEQ
jgi:hypothetical protein